MPEQITETPVQSSIYSFMKDNELTSKSEADFNTEYADSAKAKELYGFFTENELTAKDFDSFYKDNFSSIQAPDASRPQTFIQKELRDKGLIQDEPVVKENLSTKQPEEEQGFIGKLGNTVGNSFMTGMNNLNSWAADAPAFIYDLAGAPFRAVGLSVPTSQDFKDTPLQGISNFYKDNAKAYEQKVEQANPSRGNGVITSFENGDIEGGVLNLLGGIAESAPASIAMMLSGGATAPTIIGGAAIFGAGKAQEMDENAPEIDYDKRRVIAALNGTLEGVFETYLGSGAVGKSLAGIIKNEGKEVAQQSVKRSMSTLFADMITKNPWLAPLGEGFEEVGTQISQNFVDKYSGYKPNLNLTEGVGDSFLSGVGMGGIHGAVIGLAKKAMEEKQSGSQQQSEPVSSDTTPQFTVNPRDTKEAELRQFTDNIVHPETGKITIVNVITPGTEENVPMFVAQTDVTGGFLLKDEQGNIAKNPDGSPMFYKPIGHEGEVQEISVDDWVNGKMGEYDLVDQQKELLIKKNIAVVGGKQLILTGDQTPQGYVAIDPESGSDVVIPAQTIDQIRQGNDTGAIQSPETINSEVQEQNNLQSDASIPSQDNGLTQNDQNQQAPIYPLDKDGQPDVEQMDEVQLFNYNKETFGEETAIADLQGDIQLVTDKITKAEKKLTTADTKTKIKTRIEIQKLQDQKAKLEQLIPQVAQNVNNLEQQPENIAENTNQNTVDQFDTLFETENNSQNNELQNEDSEKVIQPTAGIVAKEGENTPQENQGERLQENLEENVNELAPPPSDKMIDDNGRMVDYTPLTTYQNDTEAVRNSTIESLRNLPETIEDNRGNRAYEIFDTIDWNNQNSIIEGFSKISEIIASKWVSNDRLIEYLRTKSKLLNSRDFWTKDYIGRYIAASTKDFSSLVKTKETIDSGRIDINDVEVEIPTEFGGQVVVKHKGKVIPFEQFGLLIDGKYAFIGKVKKKTGEIKGIGTVAYIKLGEQLAEKGITLTSSGAMFADGMALWQRLAKMGYAKKQGSDFVFTPKPLNKNIISTDQPVVESLTADPVAKPGRLIDETTKIELTEEQRITANNKVIDLVDEYNSMPKNHVNKKRIAFQNIQAGVQRLGYSIAENSGKLEIQSNGKKIQRIGTKQTTEDIQAHKVLIDYPEEVQSFIRRFIDNPTELFGLDLHATTKQANQGIKNIQEGKKTVAANEVLDSFEKMFNDGVIRIKGSGVNGYYEIPIDEYLSAINEQLAAIDVEKELDSPSQVDEWLNENKNDQDLEPIDIEEFENDLENYTNGKENINPEEEAGIGAPESSNESPKPIEEEISGEAKAGIVQQSLFPVAEFPIDKLTKEEKRIKEKLDSLTPTQLKEAKKGIESIDKQINEKLSAIKASKKTIKDARKQARDEYAKDNSGKLITDNVVNSMPLIRRHINQQGLLQREYLKLIADKEKLIDNIISGARAQNEINWDAPVIPEPRKPLNNLLEDAVKAREEKKPVQVKLFKHGEGGTKGLFEDSKGNLYKSLIQTWTSFKNGELIKNEATKDSPEYEILKALQGNPNIPVIGERVETSEGAAFEIERLEDVDKLTLSEFFEIEKILDDINGQGFFVNDIVTVMRRPKSGELVIVDFSGGLNDKALIGNSSYSDNGFTSRLFEMLSEEDKAEGRRIRKEKHEQLLEKYFGKKDKKTEFKYNLRSRPFSIGTFPPDNFIRFEEDGTQFGSVIYSKEVPLSEVKRFELVPSAEGLVGDYDFVFSDKKFPAKIEIAKHQKGFDIIKTTINGKEEKMSVVEFMEQVNSGRFVRVEKQSTPLPEEKQNVEPRKPLNDLLADAKENLDDDIRFSKKINDDPNLVVVHNIKEDGLLNADKIGGLAMPSLAIVNVNHGFTSYGDITLIADKDLIDPKKNRFSKVFASDVYSARYPSIAYELSNSGSRKLLAKIQSVLDKEISSTTDYHLEEEIQGKGLKELLRSRYAQLLFLKDNGREFEYQYEQSKYPESIKQAFIDNGWKNIEYFEISDNKEVKKKITDLYLTQYDNDPEYKEAISTRLLDEDGILKGYSIPDFISRVKSEIRNAGKIDLTETLRSAEKFIEENNLQKEFEAYAKSLYSDLGVTEKIFKGFNNSGNRVYTAHTLENVLKSMKKDGIRAGESSFYGSGSVRAQVTPQFNSIKDIQAKRGSIIENFDAIKEEANNGLFEILDAIKSFYKYDSSNFGYSQNAAEELVTLSRRGSSESFNKLTPELHQQVSDYLTKLANMPTEYFEAKINRGVSIAEFKAALVPSGLSQEAKDVLKFNGVEAIEYSDQEDRKEKLKQYTEDSDIRFSKKVYHGSPHSFDRFSLDKIGTGEGVQAYGWGLYFTDKKNIAEQYADLAKKKIKEMYDNGEDMPKEAFDLLNKVDFLGFDDEWQAASVFSTKKSKERVMNDYDITSDEYDSIVKALTGGRNLYSTTLHEGKEPGEYDYLRWDKPVGREKIKSFLDYIEKEYPGSRYGLRTYYESLTDGKYDDISGELFYNGIAKSVGQLISKSSPKARSLMLLDFGIDGIQYPTEYLSKGSQEESFNYVVFDENAVTVNEHAMFNRSGEISGNEDSKSLIESQVKQFESESKYQTQINYLDNIEAADYLEGRIPDRFIPEIRNTPFQGMTAAGEIFINPKSRKNKSNVLVTWVHEKTHIEISRQYPDRQERQDYFTWAYNEIGQEEIERIIPEEYWDDPINLQAEEYFAFLNEGIAKNGNIDPLITNEVKLATFELLNGFTTLKTIQDARTRSNNQTQLGRTGRDSHEGSTERTGLPTNASLRQDGTPRFDRSLRQDGSGKAKAVKEDNRFYRGYEAQHYIDSGLRVFGTKNGITKEFKSGAVANDAFENGWVLSVKNIDPLYDKSIQYKLDRSLPLTDYLLQAKQLIEQKKNTPVELNSPSEIEDKFFTQSYRPVLLPSLPKSILNAIGIEAKPVLIKRSIFTKNRNSHKELSPEDSRYVLQKALYNPDLIGRSQPKKREYYWVAVKLDEKNATVVIDVYPEKDAIEIVGWRLIDNKGLERLKKQAEREDEQLLILSPETGLAAALSTLPTSLSDKDTNNSELPNTILINGVSRPTLNSNGKPIANSEEGIRNFWKWFGDSKVVDAEGRPLLAYHGSPNKFSEFKPAQDGIWFATNNKVADGYANDNVNQTGNGVVYSVYLKIQDPLNSISAYRPEADGYINKYPNGDIYTAIVFNSSQIKSAIGNNGSFNPDDNNINFKKEVREPLDTFLANAAEQYQEKKKTRRNLAEVKEKVREFIQDHDLPIRRLEELIKKGGGTIKDNMKPYRDMSNSYGRNETLYKNFSKDKMEPVIKTISKIIKSGVSGIEVLPYMISKHAIERNAYMRENEFKEWEENAKAELQKWTDANVDIPQATKDRKVKEFNDEVQAKRDELQKKDYSGVKWFDPEKRFDNPDELAQNIVDEFEDKVAIGLVDELWENVKEASSDIVNFWKAGQTMSAEQAEVTKNRFKYFIPLRGWREGAAKQLAYKKGDGFAGSLQRAKGRTSFAENPLAYLQQTAFKAIGEQVDNEVKTSLLNLVTGNYDSEFQKYYHLKKAYYVKVNLPDGTFEWEMTMDRPSEEMFASGDAKTKIYEQYQKLRTPSQAHEHEIYIKRPSGDMIVVMSDEMLPVAQAMNHKNTMYRDIFFGVMDAEFWNKPLSKTIGRANNWLKAMYTAWNVVFPLTNFARDIQESSITQFIKGDSGHMVLANYKNAFPAIISDLRGKTPTGKYGMMLQEFRSVGGNTGYTHLKTPEQLEKEIKGDLNIINRKGTFRGYTLDQLIKVKGAVEAWNQVFEDATRFSVYITSRENGKSMGDAASDAKEASVNFNRKGKSSKAFDSVWAFWNVAIQSMQKNFKLAKDYPGRFSIVAGSWVALGFIEAMLNDMAGGDDDEDYYNISAYVRENYLILPNIPALIAGNKSDKYLRIPLSQFWRGFKSAGSIAYDVYNGKMDGLTATGKALSNFIGGLSPIDLGGFVQDGEFSFGPLMPTIYKTKYEIDNNRDYMGFKITKEPFTQEQKTRLADSGLGKDNVNPAIKFCTDWLFRAGGGDNENRFYSKDGVIKEVPGFLDINPSVIEHLITGYTGGTGRFIDDALTTAMQAAIPDQEVDFKNAPFLNSFFKKIPEAKWKIIGEYYDMKSDGTESKFDALKTSYFNQEDKTKFKELAPSGYYNEFNATLEAYDEVLTQKMKFMDYKTAEGSEEVTNTMKDAIQAIKEIKQKYNR